MWVDEHRKNLLIILQSESSILKFKPICVYKQIIVRNRKQVVWIKKMVWEDTEGNGHQNFLVLIYLMKKHNFIGELHKKWTKFKYNNKYTRHL